MLQGVKGKWREDAMVGAREKGEGTMAAAVFEAVMNGLGLVFGDVIEDVEMLLLLFVQGGVELVGDHLIGPALKR